jgi:hypothetical protein
MPTVATLSFTTFNPIPTNGLVKISIPSDQFVISSATSLAITDATSGEVIPLIATDGLNGGLGSY